MCWAACSCGLRPKILYTIPDYQNPTGLSMNAERRQELVRLARRYGFLILEDVAYRDLGFSPRRTSRGRLAPDVVLQAKAFSKIFFPGVRLGWAAGPDEIISRSSSRSRTPTSAPAHSASGCSRSMGGLGTWTGR
jgi:2-aminoadipate transaminase